MRGFDDRPLWGLWLIGLLVIVWVAQLADVRPNDVESGAATERPSFEPSRLLDENYYATVDGWLESDFALRGAGLRARAAVDYDLFGDSPVPDLVVAGKDGWLFLTAYLDPGCDALREVAPPAAARDEADAWFVVTSPKAAYHGDALRDDEHPCVVDARADLRSAFSSHTVDVDGVLRAVRAVGRDAFLRDDTHWSMEGRLEVAHALIEAIEPGRWDPDAVSTGEVQRLADLARLIGIRRADPVAGPVVSLPVEILDQRMVSLNGELVILQESRADGDGVIPGVTYLVGDSQMSYVLPLVAPYFEDLRFVNWFVIEGFGFPADDWPDPDRVIVQSIEHGAAERMMHPDLASYLDRLEN